jgi:hypothetical protein
VLGKTPNTVFSRIERIDSSNFEDALASPMFGLPRLAGLDAGE